MLVQWAKDDRAVHATVLASIIGKIVSMGLVTVMNLPKHCTYINYFILQSHTVKLKVQVSIYISISDLLKFRLVYSTSGGFRGG